MENGRFIAVLIMARKSYWQAQVLKIKNKGRRSSIDREHLQKQKSYPVASEKKVLFSR